MHEDDEVVALEAGDTVVIEEIGNDGAVHETVIHEEQEEVVVVRHEGLIFLLKLY